MTEPSRKVPRRSKYLPWVVIGLILVIMAATVAIITVNLRRVLRTQIIQQDGMMLYAASMVPTSVTEGLAPSDAADPEFVFADLTLKVLQAAEQQGVLALRIFDDKGQIIFDDKGLVDATGELLTKDELERARGFRTMSSFTPDARLNHRTKGVIRAPLIRALVPLRQDEKFLGAAEFLLDGDRVDIELKRLDTNLWKYSIRILLLGGGIMTFSLWWAFGRLQRTMGLLEQRTQSLLRANHELTLAAKTSAVGAITAHLIHDLKSPLFGLQSFVTARGSVDEEDWDLALNSTQRMQKLIQEIVKLLQEEKTTEKYELSIIELLSLLHEKLEPECEKAEITFKTEGSMRGTLMNRDANIIMLLITNLVHNAAQATPKGGEICVKVSNKDGDAFFDIRDTGPGLPEHILATLFTPSRSTKAGGTGLGLAISKQLANHIGAELTLKETSKSGTVFQLRVPERMLTSELVAQ
jgi:signal transduction histidine kinase